MSKIIPNIVVSMPTQLFTLRRKFQACSNGKIYIGKSNTDPTIPTNQIQVYIENEDGSTVPVAQPIMINHAGFPVYNGQIAKFVTVESHSMAVYDSDGAQQFYFADILKYGPNRFKEQAAQYIAYIEKLKGTTTQTTGDSTTDVMSQKACTDTFAEKNSKEPLKAGRLNLESSNGDTIFNLGGTDGSAGSEFTYVKNSKRTQIYDTATQTTLLFPQKNGTLAVEEDTYTKTEVDAKINSVKWTTNKLANGWMKDPNTGIIIQWGSVYKTDRSRKLFPMAFPNTLAGMGLANFNYDDTLSEMYAPNIMSADKVGFKMRQSLVTDGYKDSPLTDMRWIAIGW